MSGRVSPSSSRVPGRRDERAPLPSTRFVSSVALLLLLSLDGSGWGARASRPDSAVLTTAADPREALAGAMRAMLAATSYRARSVSSSSSGTTGTAVLEFVAPDRFHITRETELPGRPRLRQETIVIGDTTWMKRGDAPWQPFPINVGDLIRQFRNPRVIEELANATEVKLIGPDTIEGAPALVYEYTLSQPGEQGLKSTARAWVDVARNLPRRTEGEAELSLGGKPVRTKTVVTYSDYGATIRIEPPM